MLTIQRTNAIAKLAFPIGIALSSTLTMELIGLAMVGRLGTAASAAAGLSDFGGTLGFAFMAGLPTAVQGLVARGRGAGSTEPEYLSLKGALIIALAVGIPLTIILYLLTPLLFSFILSDPELTKIAVPFLRTLYIAIVGVGVNLAFKGYWAGMGKPTVYTLVILFTDCLSVFLNYSLIFGHCGAPALGAEGAAVATTLSLYAAAIIHGAIACLRFRGKSFWEAKIERPLLVCIARLAAPVTLQEVFFSGGYVTFFWIVGQ